MLWSPRMAFFAFLLVLLAAAGLVVYHKIYMAVPNLDAYPVSPLITRPTSSFNSAAGTANSSYDYANSITRISLKSIKMERRHAKRPPGRRLLSDNCTEKDINIHQGPEGTIFGIPQYIVQIVNTCLPDSEYAPSDVHVFCGWFASAPLVEPNVFRRIAYDDCLVNDGKPLGYGKTIRFHYANSFMYPLRLKSAKFG